MGVILLASAYLAGRLTRDDRVLEGLMHAGLTDPQRRAVVTELAACMQQQRPFNQAAFDLIAL